MISSSANAIPVKLPIPPADPVVAARALAALRDEAVPLSLDVYIKWAVESGNIVNKGEKIAQLFYTFHGMPPPHLSNTMNLNNGSRIIRARLRRNDKVQDHQQEASVQTYANESNGSPKEDTVTAVEIRSPSNGILTVVFKNNFVSNAVRINQLGLYPELSAINLILAAIKPCEHPAVVGELCVVCGADMRPPRKMQPENGEINKSLSQMRDAVDVIQQDFVLDKEKKIAALTSTSAALDREQGNDMFVNFDQFAGTKPTPTTQVTTTRSLSSFLSGARATNKLQDNPKQSQDPCQHPRQNTLNMSSSAIDNYQMIKMTVSGGVTIAVSESEAKNITEVSSRKLREEKKLCLVLDLDHTLLHATDDSRAGRFVANEIISGSIASHKSKDENNAMMWNPTRMPNPEKRDDVRSILLPVEMSPIQQKLYVQQKLQQQQKLESTKFCLLPLPLHKQGASTCVTMRHFIKLRPHLKEFFSQIQSSYQLSVYTAGTRSYAEQIALMICRHLVGTKLDEDGLNELRMKVKENEEECKRFDPGIWENLMKLSNKDYFMHNDSNGENPDNSLSFHDGPDHESKSSSLSLSSKRNSSEVETQIPKKLKGAETPRSNLQEFMKERHDSMDDCLSASSVDPTKERFRLQKDLEVAEMLEIKAFELRRKLFGSRIVSRTDVSDLGIGVKSLKRVFPCGGLMAAILDDREDVWANAKNNVTGRPGEPPDNLLLVKPYHWDQFSDYSDINNASGQDLSVSNDIESQAGKPNMQENDTQLLWTANILRRLHDRYYSAALSSEEREKTSVPSLLHTMRKETFLRFPQVKIVFSGLIPVNKQFKQTQRPNVVRYAEELGAEVLPGISSQVTHVVAARDRSEKVCLARKQVPGCFIVHTSWLMECYWSISWRDEEPHHMGLVPNHLSNRHTTTYQGQEESDDNESEDSFAKNLEKEIMLDTK